MVTVVATWECFATVVVDVPDVAPGVLAPQAPSDPQASNPIAPAAMALRIRRAEWWAMGVVVVCIGDASWLDPSGCSGGLRES
jgi:hypothetical protein